MSSSSDPKRLSCVSCRQRKVKCNRLDPCNHCIKAGQKCVFPKPVRVRGGSKVRNAEITKRISRLESLLQKINGTPPGADLSDLAELSGDDDASMHAEETPQPQAEHEPLHKSDGTRYLGGDLWATLSGEVDGLRQLLDQSDEDEDEQQSGSSRSHASEPAPPAVSPFFFNPMNPPLDLRQLHPHPPLIMGTFCDIYFTRVDPCFKVLHQPTVRRAFASAAADLRKGLADDRPLEALMFAFYFISVSALTPHECKGLLSDDKDSLLQRYKQGTEAALANADFLNSTELTTLQAFLIYVICVRTTTTSRVPWALASLAARLAQALGLHRDEDNDACGPFEAQMRRRAWWAVVVMDSCFSEDRGTPRSFLTPDTYPCMAANVNDADLWPGMPTAVQPRHEWTEMTFCLLCQEAAIAANVAIGNTQPRTAGREGSGEVPRSLEEMVAETRELLRDRYLWDADKREPLQRLAVPVARSIVARRWLGVYYPLHTRRVIQRSTEIKAGLLAAAVSTLEQGDAMEQSDKAAPFRWFLQLWSQWYPLSVALAELCTQTSGPTVERAWALLDSGFVDLWAERIADGSGGLLWKPIAKLWDKARDVRRAATGKPTPAAPRASRTHSARSATTTTTTATSSASGASSSSAAAAAARNLPPATVGPPSDLHTPWELTSHPSADPSSSSAAAPDSGLTSQVTLGTSVVGFLPRDFVSDDPAAELPVPTPGSIPWLDTPPDPMAGIIPGADGGRAARGGGRARHGVSPGDLGGATPASSGGGSAIGGMRPAMAPAIDAPDGDLEIEGWGDWEHFLTGTFHSNTPL